MDNWLVYLYVGAGWSHTAPKAPISRLLPYQYLRLILVEAKISDFSQAATARTSALIDNNDHPSKLLHLEGT